MQAKLWTWIGGEDVCAVSDAECDQKLRTLKEDMMKAFDYSEGNLGCLCMCPCAIKCPVQSSAHFGLS